MSFKEWHSRQSGQMLSSSENTSPLTHPQPAARTEERRLSNRLPASSQPGQAAGSHPRPHISRSVPYIPSTSRSTLHREPEISLRSSSSWSESTGHPIAWWLRVKDSRMVSRHNNFVTSLYLLWNIIITPSGLFLTIYFISIVAWGGMAFLLIVNAAPSMCHPNCRALDSSRNDWIETDSRVTVLLLATMVLGLSPWRLRDLYYLLTFRIRGRQDGLKQLEQIHNSWLHFPSSSNRPNSSTSTSSSTTELDIYSIPYTITKPVLSPPPRPRLRSHASLHETLEARARDLPLRREYRLPIHPHSRYVGVHAVHPTGVGAGAVRGVGAGDDGGGWGDEVVGGEEGEEGEEADAGRS